MIEPWLLWDRDEEFRHFCQNKTLSQEGPFFVYHQSALAERLKTLSTLPAQIFYATKANPHPSILNLVAKHNLGIDVASLGELKRAQDASQEKTKILATGPAKSKSYLRHFLQSGVDFFVLESLQQCLDLESLCQEYGREIQALLRVQMVYPTDSSKNVLGGDKITPFGHSFEEWGEILKQWDHKGSRVKLIGLHNFQWGNITEIDTLVSYWDSFAQNAIEFCSRNSIPLKFLDLGGGLGVSYDFCQGDLDFPKVYEALNSFKSKYNTQIILEIGRYISSAIGFYFNQVVDRKTVRGQEMLVMQGGINHLLRPVFTQTPFPTRETQPRAGKTKSFSLHGPLCTSLDFLGNIFLSEDIQIGDWLVSFQTGAYASTEAMPDFLLHPHAPEILYP